MKKILSGLLFLMLLMAPRLCFATAATVTTTEYGYEVTGNTGATVISVPVIWVRAIAFSAATANDTATLTSGATNIACWDFNAVRATDPSNNILNFSEKQPFINLTVTLSSGSDKLYIYTI